MNRRVRVFCCLLLLICTYQIMIPNEVFANESYEIDLKNALKQIHLAENFQGEILTRIYLNDLVLTYQTGILKDNSRSEVSAQHTFWQLKGTNVGRKLRAIPWFYLPPDFSLVQYALPIQRLSTLSEPLLRIGDDYDIKLVVEEDNEAIFELSNEFIIQKVTYDKNKNVITKIEVLNSAGSVMSSIIYSNWEEYYSGILLPESIQVFGDEGHKLMEMVYLNWKVNQGVDEFARTLPDEWNQRVKSLKDKIFKEPGQDQLHFKLAQLYEEQQFWSNALEELDKAYTLNPKIEYREKIAHVYAKLGDYQKAIHEIQAVLEKKESGEGYFFLGNLYSNLNNPMFAEEAYEDAVNLDGENVTFWERLFWNYRNVSMNDERMLKKAIDAGEKLVELDSYRYQYRIYLGDLYLQNQDYDKALNQYLEAQKMEPDESLPFIRLASYYEENNKYDEAVAALVNAVKVQENWWNYLQLGDFYLRNAQLENALYVYGQSLQMNPRNTDLSIKMGRVLWQLGKEHEAKMYWYQSLEYEETNIYTYIKVGEMFLEYNLFEEAQAIFKEAIERFQLLGDRSLMPGLSRIYEEMGLMYLTKDPAKSIESFEKAYSYQPSSIAGNYLGLKELKDGNMDRAIRYWEEANLLDGDNIKSYLYITVIKGLKGEIIGKKEVELEQVKESLNIEYWDLMDKFFDYFSDIRALKTESENTPVDAERAFNEGLDAFMEGDLSKALVDLERAVKVDPHFKKGNFYLGVILSLVGQPLQAQEYFKSVQTYYAGSNIARISAVLNQMIQKLFWESRVFK